MPLGTMSPMAGFATQPLPGQTAPGQKPKKPGVGALGNTLRPATQPTAPSNPLGTSGNPMSVLASMNSAQPPAVPGATPKPPMSQPGPAGVVPPDSRSMPSATSAPPSTGITPAAAAHPPGPMGMFPVPTWAPNPYAPPPAPAGAPGAPAAAPAAKPEARTAAAPPPPPAAAPSPMESMLAGAAGRSPQVMQTATAVPAESPMAMLASSGAAPPPRGYTRPTPTPPPPPDAGPPPAPAPTPADPSNRTVLPNPAPPPPPAEDGNLATPPQPNSNFLNEDWQNGYRGDFEDLFDESGRMTRLPTPDQFQAFINASGLVDNPEFSGTVQDLYSQFDKLRKALSEPLGANSENYKQAMKQINEIADKMGRHGLPVDLNALVAYYTTGEGAGEVPGTGAGPDGIIPGEGTNLGTVDPSGGAPDWLRNMDPVLGQAWLAWLGNQQARDDRQLAINNYSGYFDYLNNDPTRSAMADFLGEGTRYTLDPATVDAIKAKDRSLAGKQAAEAENILRKNAAARGQPTAINSGDLLRARSDIYGDLSSRLNDVDIQAATQKRQDEMNYWNTLLGGNAALSGPMSGAYGTMASLIAGTPGLANTGNPFQGVADYRLQQQQLEGGAMNSGDWAGILASLGGNALGAIF